MMRRRKGWSYRNELNNRTAAAMIANNSGVDDKAAIRFFSNSIMDDFEKQGIVSRAESDRMSQDITIAEVQKLMHRMKDKNYRTDKYLIAGMLQAPTFKTVNYSELKPLDDGHAVYRGKMYATKEDLKYMPSKVRLVEIKQ